MFAGDYDTIDTRGNSRARYAVCEAGFGILDVCHDEIAHGTVAACGRAQGATKHGAPLFGWPWQRRANARRLMQRWRRWSRTHPPVMADAEVPF